MPKTDAMIHEAADFSFIEVASEVDALLLEANQIRKHLPHYNIAGKDGKNFPLIEITDLVRVVREESNPKAKYFGPYPTGSDIRGLLRFLRKIFPYASTRHKPGERCFYSHLGLCPCPDLKTNHKYLIGFLEGKRTSVQKQLEKEMRVFSKAQNFEKAAEIKRKLDQIAYITSGENQPWQYEQNPNLVQDRRNEEVSRLGELLKIPNLKKIEAYDISNTSGKQATGAQVTFIDGEPVKKFYRRYKINTKNSPDDYAMLSEMIARRLKSDIPLPDLFVIDGGRGHLSFKRPPLLKVIALAKKQETIYTDDGKEINLPLDSPALHLLQRLRDEAHRFSRKYHFLLRSKKMLS